MFKIKLIILFIFILIFIFIFNNFVYAQATEKNDKQKIVLENDFLVLINNDFDEKNIKICVELRYFVINYIRFRNLRSSLKNYKLKCYMPVTPQQLSQSPLPKINVGKLTYSPSMRTPVLTRSLWRRKQNRRKFYTFMKKSTKRLQIN